MNPAADDQVSDALTGEALRAPFPWFAPNATMSALLFWYHEGRLLEKWLAANEKNEKDQEVIR